MSRLLNNCRLIQPVLRRRNLVDANYLEIQVTTDRVFVDALGISLDEASEFNRRARCTAYAFMSKLGPVRTGKVQKIGIVAQRLEPRPSHVHDMHKIYGPGDRWISAAGGDVMLIYRYFDIRGYFQTGKNNSDIAKIICEDVHAAFLKHGWNAERVVEACRELALTDYRFAYTLCDAVPSRNRMLNATLKVEADEETGRVVLVFKNSNGEVLCEKVVKKDPWLWSEFFWSFKKLVWKGSDTIELRTSPKMREFSRPIKVPAAATSGRGTRTATRSARPPRPGSTTKPAA